MALDLTKYGINAAEIVHNPSYEFLYEEVEFEKV